MGSDGPERGAKANAWPMVTFIDEMSGHGIAQGVLNFAQDIGSPCKVHVTGFTTIPQVLPAAELRVDAFGNKFVDEMTERRNATFVVGKHYVPMV